MTHGHPRRAVVAGAGIGGLTAALALRRTGWTVTVWERELVAGEIGAGLALAPNATRALATLGIELELAGYAAVAGTNGFRDPHGRWLVRIDVAAVARAYGPTVLLNRADLHAMLVEALGDGTVVTGTTVTALEQDAEGVRIHGEGPTGPREETAELLVGADGLGSTVRSALFPAHPGPAYAGYTAWRAVIDVPDAPREGGETIGRGLRFGMSRLGDGRLYWYATATTPPGGRDSNELARVRELFGRWHQPIPAVLEATQPSAVLRHDVVTLPPLPTFVTGRVALLGDAAHAMTPDLGQGACQAIEDAVVLAAALGSRPDVAAALGVYDQDRRPRTQSIARRSRQTGRAMQLRNPLAAVTRDLAMRAATDRAVTRGLRQVFSWTPPHPPDR